MKCKKAGCRANSRKLSSWCFWHDPDCAQERRAAARKGGSRGLRIASRDTTGSLDIAQVKEVLSQAIQELRASNAEVVARCRAIAFVANTLLVAIEKSGLEDRIVALEAALKGKENEFIIKTENTRNKGNVP